MNVKAEESIYANKIKQIFFQLKLLLFIIRLVDRIVIFAPFIPYFFRLSKK